ncbi:MAG: dynamin family protein, partial [Selenomonadaceae bacterium]|nr:dynamin family protein [Selenomonadaceae bacterium]
VLNNAKHKNEINEENSMTIHKTKYDVNQDISAKRYSVAVVATMSAGKSTLLNAMLGKKILPSKIC